MCFQGDYAALLSSFTELGLKLRMDMPEDAMQVTNFFFRRSIPGKESPVSWITLSNMFGVAQEVQNLYLFPHMFIVSCWLARFFYFFIFPYGIHLVLVVYPLTVGSQSCILLMILKMW